MSLRRYAFCLLPLALLSTAQLDGKALMVFNVHEELSIAARDLEHRILDLIEPPIRYYLRSDVDHDDVDLNLMLGVSIMKGQFMSCSDHSRMSFNTDISYKMSILNTLIENLYTKFYKNNLMGSTSKILDPQLWTSGRWLTHESNITLPAKWYNKHILANGDSYFRNISDKCIGQVISSCNVTYECFQPEFRKQFFGYALTHQVLYVHIVKKMKCKNLKYRNLLREIIQHKCSTIFKEAQNMANDFKMLEKYKDLFIEQIAVCGMQNIVDFFRPEWFSIIVSSTKHFDCIQHKNNKLNLIFKFLVDIFKKKGSYKSFAYKTITFNDFPAATKFTENILLMQIDSERSCDSHLAGVSLAALGVYWKFLCYKVNTYGAY